ncbi:putative phosphatidylinositol 3-kinase [Helianthus anomalus]
MLLIWSTQRILKYPPTRTFSGDERQLLWKFRFSLMSEKRALTKFLRCVEWSDVQEAKQAIELMGRWEMIDVRAHAVRALKRANDEELQCFYFNWFNLCALTNIELASFLRWYVAVELHDPAYAKRFYCTYEMLEENMIKQLVITLRLMLLLGMGAFDGGDGFKLWQSLVRQTELTAQVCSIMRDVRNVPGGTQKKIEKLWHLFRDFLVNLHTLRR